MSDAAVMSVARALDTLFTAANPGRPCPHGSCRTCNYERVIAAFEGQVRADERERAARILDENVSCPDRSCERCGALRVNAEAIRRGTKPAEEEAANG